MQPDMGQLLDRMGLSRLTAALSGFRLPAIRFSLIDDQIPPNVSKLGGVPDVPPDFVWPDNKGRPLDFLLQINLKEASAMQIASALPLKGLLSFFYDLEKQPWGFDPKDLSGFHVLYIADATGTEPKLGPATEYPLKSKRIAFRRVDTFPAFGSRSYDRLETQANLSEKEEDQYMEFIAQIEALQGGSRSGGHHRLLGHSENIQGDMQLEAQLVSNGLYCGDLSGYEDPRAKTLELGADDWILLLQLDSDDNADMMWGDCGMLYFWIHRNDLEQGDFQNVWMSLQCC